MFDKTYYRQGSLRPYFNNLFSLKGSSPAFYVPSDYEKVELLIFMELQNFPMYIWV